MHAGARFLVTPSLRGRLAWAPCLSRRWARFSHHAHSRHPLWDAPWHQGGVAPGRGAAQAPDPSALHRFPFRGPFWSYSHASWFACFYRRDFLAGQRFVSFKGTFPAATHAHALGRRVRPRPSLWTPGSTHGSS